MFCKHLGGGGVSQVKAAPLRYRAPHGVSQLYCRKSRFNGPQSAHEQQASLTIGIHHFMRETLCNIALRIWLANITPRDAQKCLLGRLKTSCHVIASDLFLDCWPPKSIASRDGCILLNLLKQFIGWSRALHILLYLPLGAPGLHL